MRREESQGHQGADVAVPTDDEIEP
jgi:hypothetical protein